MPNFKLFPDNFFKPKDKNFGKLIVFEGLDGSGKTTLAQALAKKIKTQVNNTCVLNLREPGGTPEGEKIRSLILQEGEGLTNLSEMLLFFACRAQLLERLIIPKLQEGAWILLDRYLLSSFAYQGGGKQSDLNKLRQLAFEILPIVSPDLTFYLSIDLECSLKRQKKRNQKEDLMERQPLDFWDRVHKFYEAFAQKPSNNLTVLDGMQPACVVLNQAWEKLVHRFPELMEGVK